MHRKNLCSTKGFDARHTYTVHALTALWMDNILALSCRFCKESSPKRDTFEVGIDLLTAVSLSDSDRGVGKTLIGEGHSM